MDKSWKKALRDSISDTFSTMFFVVPESDENILEGAEGKPVGGWLEGWIEFSKGAEKVRIWVWSPPELAMELASNILSCDPDEVSEEDLLDSYREMLNMVAGNVLTAVDQNSQWKMGLPNAAKLDGGDLAGLAAKSDEPIPFDAEDRPLLAGWHAE